MVLLLQEQCHADWDLVPLIINAIPQGFTDMTPLMQMSVY